MEQRCEVLELIDKRTMEIVGEAQIAAGARVSSDGELQRGAALHHHQALPQCATRCGWAGCHSGEEPEANECRSVSSASTLSVNFQRQNSKAQVRAPLSIITL